MNAEDLITKVTEGEEPDKVVKQVLHDMKVDNPKYMGGIDQTGDKRPNFGINNKIHLESPGDMGKAQSLLDDKEIKYTVNPPNILGFDYNSARDSAAQLLSSHGIVIKSVA